MGTFRHTPDNIIFFDSDSMPLSFFITQESAYALPSGMIEQRYIQGTSYVASDGNNEKVYAIPNATLDGYITNKASYIAAYDAYLHPEPSLQELKDAKKILVDKYRANIALGGVVFDSVVYPTNSGSYDRIFMQHTKYTRDLGVPVGHYVLDADGMHQALDLSEHEDLLDICIDLYVLCYANADSHKEAIQALTTAEDVAAYDFTTGWVITPYDPLA